MKKGLIIFCLLLSAQFVFAANLSKVFYNPMVNGYRVDICLHWGNKCGKPAADRFCQINGYDNSATFQYDNDIGAVSPTLVLGDNKVCDASYCDGFKHIRCVRTAATNGQRFYNPMVNGYRVDICYNWGRNCGQIAANQFCQIQGYQRAIGFEQDADIGARTPTLVVGDNKLCSQNFCDGFKHIDCE